MRITDDGEKLPDVNSMRESGIGFRTVAHRVRAIQASMETRYEKKNSEFKLIFNLKNIAININGLLILFHFTDCCLEQFIAFRMK